jgi:hypothetical protein
MTVKLVWSQREGESVSHREQEVAVRAVIESYVDACWRGDDLALRALFHPEAAMSGFLGDSAISGSLEPFFEAVAHNPAPLDAGLIYETEIAGVSVSLRTGTAVLYERGYLGMNFINHFQLVAADGQWYITARLFESTVLAGGA